MPLVHRFNGPAFAPSESRARHRRAASPPWNRTDRIRSGPTLPELLVDASCPLCRSRAPIFDPSRRCCLDRYESQFGSVDQHRRMMARALRSAMLGDRGPARRMVESYRRVFGPMAAVELRRKLWQYFDDPRGSPFESAPQLHRQPTD